MTSKDVSDEQLGQLARRQHDLFRRVREGSIPVDEALKALQVLISAPRKSTELPTHHYRVTVASATRPTCVELVANYGEGHVSGLWDENNYKLEFHESLRELTPPTGNVTVFLKKFDRNSRSEQAIEWAKNHGYRLAFPWEREAFSKANPDLQRKFWIVDLGSFVEVGDHRSVPVLRVVGGKREVDGVWFGGQWNVRNRFLFVCE